VATSEAKPGIGTELKIRRCTSPEEFAACVDLQKEVWQFADIDIVPIRMFSVADKIGGQVLGCFDGAKLVGFTLAIPGARNGRSYLHSHMLAVREGYRNHGIGRKLKLTQREEALKQGFELMEWTFDPLEIKNAYLNIDKLGAIARRYNINQYGTSSSPLQGGLPTDRLVAEWWLKSKRVTGLLEAHTEPVVTEVTSIDVPAQVYEWKASEKERSRAAAVQMENRQKFLDTFKQGLAALAYEKDAKGNGRFILGKWDENLSYES
jgi:predicted GNAT superfamily acetyltransferase